MTTRPAGKRMRGASPSPLGCTRLRALRPTRRSLASLPRHAQNPACLVTRQPGTRTPSLELEPTGVWSVQQVRKMSSGTAAHCTACSRCSALIPAQRGAAWRGAARQGGCGLLWVLGGQVLPESWISHPQFAALYLPARPCPTRIEKHYYFASRHHVLPVLPSPAPPRLVLRLLGWAGQGQDAVLWAATSPSPAEPSRTWLVFWSALRFHPSPTHFEMTLISNNCNIISRGLTPENNNVFVQFIICDVKDVKRCLLSRFCHFAVVK